MDQFPFRLNANLTKDGPLAGRTVDQSPSAHDVPPLFRQPDAQWTNSAPRRGHNITAGRFSVPSAPVDRCGPPQTGIRETSCWWILSTSRGVTSKGTHGPRVPGRVTRPSSWAGPEDRVCNTQVRSGQVRSPLSQIRSIQARGQRL